MVPQFKPPADGLWQRTGSHVAACSLTLAKSPNWPRWMNRKVATNCTLYVADHLHRPGKGNRMRGEDLALNGLRAAYVGRPALFGSREIDMLHNCERYPCASCGPNGFCCLGVYEARVCSGLTNRKSRTGRLSIAFEAMNRYLRRKALTTHLPELRGKNLACSYALDRPCQGDILLDLAKQ